MTNPVCTKCHPHVKTGEPVFRVPVPGQKYYKYAFYVECPRCHQNWKIVRNTERDAMNEKNTYPVLPVFPK